MTVVRHRSDGNFDSSQVTSSTYYQVKPDGTKVSQSNSSWSNSGTDGMIRSMQDFVSPGFAKRVSEGEIINTPMRSRREIRAWRGDFCQVEATFTANGYRTHQHWTNWGVAISEHLGLPALTDLKLEAVTDSWSKVNAPEWWAGVDIGEFGETVALLLSPMRESARILSNEIGGLARASTVRNRLARSVPVATVAATAYLGYHLGLAPLFGSINDALKLLQKEFLERKTVRSSAQRIDRVTAPYNTQPFTAGGQVNNWHGTLITERNTRCRAGVMYVPKPSIRGDFGLESDDFLPTVWELIPFSFIVDRFINIGNFLTALAAYLTVQPLASWCVTKSITTTYVDWDRCSSTLVSGYSAPNSVPPSSSSVLTTWDVERIVNTKPGLTWSTRDIKLPTKILHNLDYLSLLILGLRNKTR